MPVSVLQDECRPREVPPGASMHSLGDDCHKLIIISVQILCIPVAENRTIPSHKTDPESYIERLVLYTGVDLGVDSTSTGV